MKRQQIDWIGMDAGQAVGAMELSQASGLSCADVQELVEYGALVPLSTTQGLTFSPSCLVPVQAVARLRSDFDLDLFTVGMLLGYIEKISALEDRVQDLQDRLSTSGDALRSM